MEVKTLNIHKEILEIKMKNEKDEAILEGYNFLENHAFTAGVSKSQNIFKFRVSSTEVRFPRIGGFRAIRRFQIRCNTLFDAQRHHCLRFDRLEMCRVP